MANIFLKISRIILHLSIRDIPYPCGETIDKLLIMRDKDESAIILFQRFGQYFTGEKIKVIRGFIHNYQVSGFYQDTC